MKTQTTPDATRIAPNKWQYFHNGRIYLVLHGLMIWTVFNSAGIIIFQSAYGGLKACEEWITRKD